MPPRPDPAPGHGVVLFDGDCPFCRKTVGLLKRLDWWKRLHFQNCREEEKWPPCAEPLVMDRLVAEMHVVPPERDRAHAGFRAVRWIFWRLPVTMLLTPLLYIPGVPWVGNRAYLWVAKNRFKIVPCDETGVCRLPVKAKT